MDTDSGRERSLGQTGKEGDSKKTRIFAPGPAAGDNNAFGKYDFRAKEWQCISLAKQN